MPNPSDGSFRMRVYFNFSDGKKKYKNYELFHLANKEETFGTLKRKVFDKLGINEKLLPHFYFTLQRLYTIEKGGQCLRPHDNDSVYVTIDKEEQRWAGSLIVIVNDMREEMRHMTKTADTFDCDYEFVDSIPSASNVDLIPESTEFVHQHVMSYASAYSQIDIQSKYELNGGESIPSQYLNEIEVSSLKSARLMKLQNVNGKEAYREMNALVTAGSLWYYPFAANSYLNNTTILQEIIIDNASVEVALELDSSGCSFTVTLPLVNAMLPTSCMNTNFTPSEEKQYIHHTFKAKSAAECQSWVDTIQQRSQLSSENDIILMADMYTSVAEEEASVQDIDILVDCTTFEGTLKNGYMREKFQSYLGKNFEEEFLLFWEYCEDFRKGHPDSEDPFDFSADFIKNSKARPCSINLSVEKKRNGSSAVPASSIDELAKNKSQAKIDHQLVLTWARYIYNKFIVDGAPMQIACPSNDRNRIEAALSNDSAPPDLFYYVQTQIYNQLKFQKFTDFVKCSNFRNVLLSTVMNNMNQCQVTGQIWCTIAPLVPSKLITSPADFYPSIFPKIDSFELKYALTSDKAVSNNKYNLLSWSPGQYDMATFNYSDSLKYEVEKDYINNYSKIPLESGVASVSPESDTTKSESVQGGRLSSFIKTRLAMRGFGKRDPEPDVITESNRFTTLTAGKKNFDVQDSGTSEDDENSHAPQCIIPTPWRFAGETGAQMSTPPHSMPFYWWRYVNPDFSQTYDQSYDEQMFDMLPDWIKCIVIDKIKSSSISGESIASSDARNTSLLHNYTKAVNKVQTVKKIIEDKPTDTNDGDVILHTCSSPLAHGISFTTCGGYEVNASQQQYRVAVPHLARLSGLHHQWPTLPMPGRIVSMVYMLASYSNSSFGFRDSSLDNKSNTITEVEDDLDRPSVADSLTNNTISQNTMLNNSSRRLCVLSYTADDKDNNKEGELRLYGTNYSGLYAIIRLSFVIKIAPSTNLMNTIEITDDSGALWHLCPDDYSLYANCSNINSNNYKNYIQKLEKRENISIEPSPSSCRSWLHYLSQLCSSRAYAVHILHEGFLSKRGRLNTAFRKRWFIMTSELVLLYYSRSESPGQSKFKGALNLLDVLEVVINENGKDFVIHTSSRDWVLRTDSKKEAESWKRAIDRI